MRLSSIFNWSRTEVDPFAIFGTYTEEEKNIYTEPDVALKELIIRRADAELANALSQDPQYDLLPFPKSGQPYGILFRQVATPTHEILHFIKMAKLLKLEPLIVEYGADKFVSSGNMYKRALGKMPIYQHTGSDGRDIVTYKTVVDFNTNVGKRLCDVQCLDGTSLMEFHHDLFERITKRRVDSICIDCSDWFHSHGGNARAYYESFLKVFIKDSILFEMFEPTEAVKQFLDDVIVPGYAKVRDEYGVKPLVVRLLPPSEQLRAFWDSYPKKLDTILKS